MNWRKLTVVCLTFVFLVTMVAGCSTKKADGKAEGEKKYKAALVMSGPINDGGWNQSAYEGLKLLESELGFEISYTENSTNDTHVNRLRDYARAGYDLVIGHGFEFGDPLVQVAKEFPKVHFAQVGGEVGGTTPNLTSAVFRTGELGYLMGRLVAETTKSNKIGFIGAMELPTLVDEVDTIKATVAKYNPEATVQVAYTGSWTDVAAAKEAAKAMMAKGCDTIVGIGDACDVGAIQAVDEAESQVWYVGWSGDRHELSPDRVATSGVQDVSVLIKLMAERFLAGEDGLAGVYGCAEGAQTLGVFGNGFPEDIKKLTEDEFNKIKSDELTRNKIMEMIGREPELVYDK